MKFITKDINKPKSNIPDEKIGEVRTLALFSTIILLLFFSDLAYGGFVLEVFLMQMQCHFSHIQLLQLLS